MNKRYLNIILKRLSHLPKGKNFIKYASNSINYKLKQKSRKLELTFPLDIMLEITNHCQLKCVTCAREYKHGMQMNRGNMDFKSVREFLTKYHIYLNKIGLTGLGEPLIYPYLEELLDVIKEINPGISVFISSNCQLPNTVDILAKIASKFDTLQISIDEIGRAHV